MLEKADRVLVGLSGGKDSLTLLAHLANLQNNFQIPFTFEALHIKSDFSGCSAKPGFLDLVGSWGVKVHILEVAIEARLKPGKSMNCYWCSTQRRTELIQWANGRGFNKIALGHHTDDILESFFMNMAYKGEISTMLPVMRYDKYKAVIIRPMALVTEEQIIGYAKETGILSEALVCPFGKTSLRLKARQAISLLAASAPGVRANIFKAMENPHPRYLPGSSGQSPRQAEQFPPEDQQVQEP